MNAKLADQVGITKQSVNDLLGHLEGHGYLVRVPDPADGRARVIRLTAKGQRSSAPSMRRRKRPKCGSLRSWGREVSPSCTSPLSYSPSDSVKQPTTTRCNEGFDHRHLPWPAKANGTQALTGNRVIPTTGGGEGTRTLGLYIANVWFSVF